MIKAILFDLDGTLLPMDQDEFVKAYFGLLSKNMSKYGYEPENMINAVWAGTKAMIMNDGRGTNEEVFWSEFGKRFDRDVRADEPLFEAFYNNEFAGAKTACGFNHMAQELVDVAKNTGCKVALATNPIFPPVATKQRIQWAGLKEDDFKLVTTYDNCCYSKPNLKYYEEIVKALGVDAKDCLMIGNDVIEDMVTEKMGMKVFLLTDCLINKENVDISAYPRGGFREAIECIKAICQ